MIDLMALSKALPELLKMAPRAEEFFGAWLQFMNKMGDKLSFLESMAQTTDNKLTFLVGQNEEISDKLTMLMTETNLTPTLQNNVWQMAEADPRNAKLMRRNVDGEYAEPPVS